MLATSIDSDQTLIVQADLKLHLLHNQKVSHLEKLT